MAILTQNIKLLKSAVMADTTDGGGQMTGTEVIDGQSNNLFPDTSAMDRAFGRVNLRKVFGVAHTADTDTLLGAHAIMTDAPDDPLVHCVLLKTANWSDERTAARDAIEKYLVRGPKAGPRIYDTHYAGSLQLRLITFVGATFPVAGDAIVLTNANGTEQYVRLLKISIVAQQVAVTEGGSVVVASANIGTCELGSPLAIDIFGPPGVRVFGVNGVASESSFASVYSTNVAGGAKFYGVKPLGAPAMVGDLSATTSSGIYTNLVPAATIETPLIDQFPLLAVPGLSPTALGTVTITNPTTSVLAPSSTLTAPTLIEPRSISLTHAGATFTDDGKGNLLQGTSVVGSVVYRTGVITIGSSSPNYGVGTSVLTYRPATGAGASVFSDARLITLSNQGLVYVESLDPPPAPGTFSVSYMAQGRWYMLLDDIDGKLSGSVPAYGTGTISYVTGSVSLTLGAIPDAGSPMIYSWGEKNVAQPFSAPLPTSATAKITLGTHVFPDSVSLSWTALGGAKTANVDIARKLTGDATGLLARIGSDEVLSFTSELFPDGNITATWQEYTSGDTEMTHVSGHNFQLTNFPVEPGSLSFQLDLPTVGGFDPYSNTAEIIDNGVGGLISRTYVTYGYYPNTTALSTAIGTINYLTGAISITSPSATAYGVLSVARSRSGWLGIVLSRWTEVTVETRSTAMGTSFTNVRYSGGVTTPMSSDVAVTYVIQAPTTDKTPFAISDSVLYVGGELHTTKGGVLRRGWSLSQGVETQAVGSVTSTGAISLQALPANKQNTVVWKNAALSLASKTISSGVFRTANAPLKSGVFQLSNGGSQSSNANGVGILSGSTISGSVDTLRGYVQWYGHDTDPALLRYNAVYLQYLPLEAALLGLETARLPLDGKVPIYRTGDLVVIHNTLSTALVNPLVKNVAYSLGRERIASVRVKDALGVVVPDTLYTTDLNGGFVTVSTVSNITTYVQPLTVEHRIEDMVLCSKADISGTLSFTRSLTHNFPADTSFVSSAMPFGDLFARAYGVKEQSTWTGVWSDLLIGSAPLASFNDTISPIAVTNAGAIKERWAVIFNSASTFYIVGEAVGVVWGEPGAGVAKTINAAPLNPATGVPYFSIPALGWGSGWSTGNVVRFNTDACGTPFWAVRTVLQGPTTFDSDQFTLAFRGDVDRTI